MLIGGALLIASVAEGHDHHEAHSNSNQPHAVAAPHVNGAVGNAGSGPKGFGAAPAAGGISGGMPRNFSGGAPHAFNSAPAPRTFSGTVAQHSPSVNSMAGGGQRTFGGEQRGFGSGAPSSAERRFGEQHAASGLPPLQSFWNGERRSFGDNHFGGEHQADAGHFGGERRFGGPGGHFSYRGRQFAALHDRPYRWPHGYYYQRFYVGGRLPPTFWVSDYYFTDYEAIGLAAPEPGFQWVRYGPDLLLVNMNTGEIADTVYDAYS